MICVLARGTIVIIMVLITSIYGALIAFVSGAAARTAGVGYVAVMVTVGVLLLACDMAERRRRDR